MSPTCVTHRTVIYDGSGAVAGNVVLDFASVRPFEVQATFVVLDEDRPCTRVWRLDRGLLVEGLERRAGLMDVVVEPDGDRLSVTLSGRGDDGGEESGTLWLTREHVERFVRHTLQLVPIGEERMDFDAELAEWLDGAQ
jgi:hypothetical protein